MESKIKIILSHPTSNQNNRAAVLGLFNVGILTKFITCVAVFPKTFWHHLSKFGSLAEFNRRRFDVRLKTITIAYPFKELCRLVFLKLGFTELTQHETGKFSVDAVYQDLDSKVAAQLRNAKKNELHAVYAYEDGALETFKTAKSNGITCLYDLPIGYWKAARTLLESQIDIWPEWRATLHGFKDSNLKLQRKDEELKLADRIFVASSFTAKTLEYFNGDLGPIEVIPYGFPEPINQRNYIRDNGPVKLLFVGGLSQRKGIANMFAAVEHLKGKVELTVIGRKPTNTCEALNTALEKHHWIPSVSHAEVLHIMQQHDVLLFPSLFEGFGLVITEAMSQGTPVITTERTAGPDLIQHGKNGWLVEAGSTEALEHCISDIVNHPECIAKVGRAAIETARKRPWSVYGEELANAIIKNTENNNKC